MSRVPATITKAGAFEDGRMQGAKDFAFQAFSSENPDFGFAAENTASVFTNHEMNINAANRSSNPQYARNLRRAYHDENQDRALNNGLTQTTRTHRDTIIDKGSAMAGKVDVGGNGRSRATQAKLLELRQSITKAYNDLDARIAGDRRNGENHAAEWTKINRMAQDAMDSVKRNEKLSKDDLITCAQLGRDFHMILALMKKDATQTLKHLSGRMHDVLEYINTTCDMTEALSEKKHDEDPTISASYMQRGDYAAFDASLTNIDLSQAFGTKQDVMKRVFGKTLRAQMDVLLKDMEALSEVFSQPEDGRAKFYSDPTAFNKLQEQTALLKQRIKDADNSATAEDTIVDRSILDVMFPYLDNLESEFAGDYAEVRI